jgi:hypothetical protein
MPVTLISFVRPAYVILPEYSGERCSLFQPAPALTRFSQVTTHQICGPVTNAISQFSVKLPGVVAAVRRDVLFDSN